MLYKDFLKTVRGCPFCTKDRSRRFAENTSAFLTYALAPYSKYHLLVVPKRHVVSFLDLGDREDDDIARLLHEGVRLVHGVGRRNCSVLVRDGGDAQKSIAHLHYHIIPDHRIGDLDVSGKRRRILTKEEIRKIVGKMRKFSAGRSGSGKDRVRRVAARRRFR